MSDPEFDDELCVIDMNPPPSSPSTRLPSLAGGEDAKGSFPSMLSALSSPVSTIVPPPDELVLPPSSSARQEFEEYLRDDATARQPVLCLVDYGMPGAYASDIWVVLHNTLRRELFDTFEIVAILRQLCVQLTYADIAELRRWWRFMVLLWTEYQGYEDEVLMPLVRRIQAIDGRVDVLDARLAHIRESGEWLQLKMVELTSYLEEFESLPAGRALCLFCAGVDRVAERMMGWFAMKERVLPAFVESYHGEDVRTGVEEALLRRLRENGCFEEGVVAIVRWMGSVRGFSAVGSQSRERDMWLARNLSWVDRQRLPYFFRRYDSVHGDVLTYFRQRKKAATARYGGGVSIH